MALLFIQTLNYTAISAYYWKREYLCIYKPTQTLQFPITF